MAQAQQQQTKPKRRLRFTVGANIGSAATRYEPGDVIDADDVPPGPRKSWLDQGILVEADDEKKGGR